MLGRKSIPSHLLWEMPQLDSTSEKARQMVTPPQRGSRPLPQAIETIPTQNKHMVFPVLLFPPCVFPEGHHPLNLDLF